MVKSIFDDDDSTPKNIEVPQLGAFATQGQQAPPSPEPEPEPAQTPPAGVEKVQVQPAQQEQSRQVDATPFGTVGGGSMFTPPQPTAQPAPQPTAQSAPQPAAEYGTSPVAPGWSAPQGMGGGTLIHQAAGSGITSMDQFGQRARQQGNRVSGGGAFAPLQFGDQVNRFPIPRIKYTEGINTLISIITQEIFSLRYHYFEGVGQVYCNQGLCCRLDGTPPVRYGIPVAVFALDQGGQPLRPLRADVKLHIAGEEAYETLLNKNAMYGSLLNKVIEVSCADEKFQRLDLTVFPDINPFASAPELLQSLLQYYEQYKASIEKAVAKSMGDNLLAAALGYDGGVVNAEVQRGKSQDYRQFFG